MEKARILQISPGGQQLLFLLGLFLILMAGCMSAGSLSERTADEITSTGPDSAGEPIQTMVRLTETPVTPTQAVIRPTDTLPVPTSAPTYTRQPIIASLLWSFKPGLASESPFWVSPLTSPTVDAGIIYVGASDIPGGARGSLHALDATVGTLLWSFDHNGHTPSTPTVAGGFIYFGSEDYNVYAIDAVRGAKLWSYATNGQVRSRPAVNEETVYVNSQDGYLYALDVFSGLLLWQFKFDDPLSDVESIGSIPSSPAVDDRAVFIASSDNLLKAINLADGTLLWEHDLDGRAFGSPNAGDGAVTIGGLNGTLRSLSASDGRLLWDHRTKGAIASSPAVEAGRVYVASRVVAALEASSGAVLWQFTPEITGAMGSPAIEGQTLYVAASGGQIYALDKEDGALLASFALDASIGFKAPAVVNGIVYFVDKERTLSAISFISPDES